MARVISEAFLNLVQRVRPAAFRNQFVVDVEITGEGKERNERPGTAVQGGAEASAMKRASPGGVA